MSHINFICEIAHAYQHMPAYFHYITQNHAYLPTHTRTWVPMMAQWPPLMRGHPFWEATFTQHLGWLLVRGFTVYIYSCALLSLLGHNYQTHWGLNKIASIIQTTFSNIFSWVKYFYCEINVTEFHALCPNQEVNSNLWLLGTKQVTSQYLNHWWLQRIYASLGNEILKDNDNIYDHFIISFH